VKEQWRQLSARFAAMQTRERVLVLAAAVLGTALVYDALVLQSLEARKKRLSQQVAESRQSVKAADNVVKAQESIVDPLAVKRSYRDALIKQLAEIDQSMQGLQRGLVPPERMAKVLEDMLAGSRGLQIMSLRSLPAQRFETPGATPPKAAEKGAKPTPATPAASERNVYEHSFEITLQGTYTDVHEYLARLEKMPWRMFWARLSVNTDHHPTLRVTLRLQTLSLSKAWLVV
jgi:MSHA biogenesis protein MshJ